MVDLSRGVPRDDITDAEHSALTASATWYDAVVRYGAISCAVSTNIDAIDPASDSVDVCSI